jgi:aldose 1-epimerase
MTQYRVVTAPEVDPGGGADQPGTEVGVGEHTLRGHGYEAVISPIGASLRSLTYQGRDLVVPFAAGQVRPLYRGAICAPWPNRIADGRYRCNDIEFQLPLNETDKGHALHGLVQWIRWTTAETAADAVELEHDLVPQDGYPFPLKLRARFSLEPDGLHTELTATNPGATAVPYGCCPHPYLLAGPSPLDDWELTIPAGQRLEVDDRLLPAGLSPVGDVDNDFRSPAVIGAREIDHAFTDLTRTGNGNGNDAEVRVYDRTNDTGVRLSWGEWAPWLQIHTADRPEPQYHRAGLAVEPMSCPPDAFNAPSGPPLIAPAATHHAQWVIGAL